MALPESIRWLVDKGRLAQADAILSRIEVAVRSRGVELAPYQVWTRSDVQPVRFAELFRAGCGRRTALCWMQWFFCYIRTVGRATWLPSLYVRVGRLPAAQGLLLTVLTTAFRLIDKLAASRCSALASPGWRWVRWSA